MGAPAEGAGAIRLTVVGKSDRGRVRAANQDNLLVMDLGAGAGAVPPSGEASEGLAVGPVEITLGASGAILMVADGMGGRAGGERASAVAVATVGDTLSEAPHPAPSADAFVRRLDSALLTASDLIHQEGASDEELRGMGTTSTLAGLLADSVYVAQVGDSRAYIARKGALERLTRDQSLVQDLIDSGVLTEVEAKNVPSNQILQALGATSKVQPVVTFHQLRRGDLLLLCSDGLSGVVDDEEIGAAIRAGGDCDELCDRLVDLANERGGPDNITVLAARVDGDGLAPPTDDGPLARKGYVPTAEG